eukprot:COSAG01_NODE_14565_length_1437_cov_8.120329_2_plen_70_part_00
MNNNHFIKNPFLSPATFGRLWRAACFIQWGSFSQFGSPPNCFKSLTPTLSLRRLSSVVCRPLVVIRRPL